MVYDCITMLFRRYLRMSLGNGEKILNVKNVMFVIFLAEMLAGIFSETYSLTVFGVFFFFYFCDFSFSAKIKNKFVNIIFKIFILIIIFYFGAVSFFESLQIIGYYESVPKLWVFPVIALLFIFRFALKIQYADSDIKNKIFPAFSVFFYIAIVVFSAISYFSEYYFEPILALSLAFFAAYLILKNINN